MAKKSKKAMLQEVLSDQEQLAIQMFVDNDVQREAVKKILLYGVYNTGTLKKGEPSDPTRNFAFGIVQTTEAQGLGDDMIGRRIRAAWEGAQIVESGFQELAMFKTEKDELQPKSNPAV